MKSCQFKGAGSDGFAPSSPKRNPSALLAVALAGLASIHCAAARADDRIVGGSPAIVGGSPAIVGGSPAIVGGSPAIVGGTNAVVGGKPAIVGGSPAIVGGTNAVVGSKPAIAGHTARSGMARSR